MRVINFGEKLYIGKLSLLLQNSEHCNKFKVKGVIISSLTHNSRIARYTVCGETVKSHILSFHFLCMRARARARVCVCV